MVTKNENKQVITLDFELLENGYKLISEITVINGITFTGEDLTK